jgi:poly(hydroxyalkanoate) depolymerase family esterase
LKNWAGKADSSATKFNASGVTETIQRALASAGLDTQSGLIKGIMDTIDRSLTTAGLTSRSEPPGGRGTTIDGTAREVDPAIAIGDARTPPAANDPVAEPVDTETTGGGEFLSGSFTNATGTRAYKVYVPACHSVASEPMPLLVMLHGCTQSPDDFAAGTRMNALAEEHGFLVVYPAQSGAANGSKCWNWFRPEDQYRDRGEPSIVAGITREVAVRYGADERRIFVAGMSAGAAMAVILGATYPDLFAAVGAHSGLAYRAARDMPSAFGAMHGGASPVGAASMATAVPTIVFHGNADHTVQARNAEAIIEQVVGSHADRTGLRTDVQTGIAAGGARYERTIYLDAEDRIVAEQWLLHGAAHAWSGGSAAGSYTDARGPDASAEMVRFFLSQLRT